MADQDDGQPAFAEIPDELELARDGRVVEAIVATGPDPAIEIADLVALNETRPVVLPSSLQRVDPDACRRLNDAVPNGVVCAGHAPALS